MFEGKNPIVTRDKDCLLNLLNFVNYLDAVTQKIDTDQDESQDEDPIYFVSDERLKKIELEM